MKRKLNQIYLIIFGIFLNLSIAFAQDNIDFEKLFKGEIGPKSTKTYSSKFSTKEEKITFLKNYLKIFSGIKETEYYIYFYNGGFAPSEWDMQVCLKINPKDAHKWYSDYIKTKLNGIEKDIKPVYTLISNNTSWSLNSKPIYFEKKNNVMSHYAIMVIYEEEGIILKRIVAY